MNLRFTTPTAVDLRELFTLGLGSKRNADKIGHKGSGLKFTLALLHRLGSRLVVNVGGRTWTSTTELATIRDQEHQLIKLVADDGTEQHTHIAVAAGADTWKEPWFALRELLQNTIDEGGTYTIAGDDGEEVLHAVLREPTLIHDDGGTVMTIELMPELFEAWQRRAEWFHPRHPEIVYSSAQGGLFYHGFAVYTDPNWVRSYDVTTIIERDNLSEDRQMRNMDLADLFRKIVLACPVLPLEVYQGFLQSQPTPDTLLLMNAVDRKITSVCPNPGGFRLSVLEDAFIAKFGEKTCFSSGSSERERYYCSCAGYKITHVSYGLSNILNYSTRLIEAEKLIPALEKRMSAVSPRLLDKGQLGLLKQALRLTASLRPTGCTVDVVTPGPGDDVNVCALAVPESNKVLLLKPWVDKSTLKELVEGLIEEYLHLSSGASDCSSMFQRAIISSYAKSLLPTVRVRRANAAFSL